MQKAFAHQPERNHFQAAIFHLYSAGTHSTPVFFLPSAHINTVEMMWIRICIFIGVDTIRSMVNASQASGQFRWVIIYKLIRICEYSWERNPIYSRANLSTHAALFMASKVKWTQFCEFNFANYFERFVRCVRRFICTERVNRRKSCAPNIIAAHLNVFQVQVCSQFNGRMHSANAAGTFWFKRR